jgi:hypothetical protein
MKGGDFGLVSITDPRVAATKNRDVVALMKANSTNAKRRRKEPKAA